MSKKIQLTVDAKELLPIDEIEFFQEDIKLLSKEAYENLAQSLIDEGIGLSLHVWRSEGKIWAIDGHQRLTALKRMRDIDGWELPKIPVTPIIAKSKEDAKRRVLIALSVSGKLKPDALAEYAKNNNINIEWMASHINPPNIDMGDFAERFMNIQKPPVLPPTEEDNGETNKMPSSSGGVKQVQLYFNSDDMMEFIEVVNELGEKYKIENISDTVLKALREANKYKR